MTDVLVTHALRSPIGTAGRMFRELEVADLAAPVLAEVAGRLDGGVGDVVLGNCMGPGGNVARVAALTAGLADDVPAVTIDRQCASGLAAVQVAARLLDDGRQVLAGGLESASTAPWRCRPPAPGAEPERYERAPFAPAARDVDMGVAADLLAQTNDISRARQDEYAARSHQRAYDAARAGAFATEIFPVAGQASDERIRAGMTAARLARLRPAFREAGTVTAGNSCGINDGAAVVALTRTSRPGRGLRILASATAAVPPETPGIGLVPAVQQVLHAAGLRVDDIDVWELNEAFAGQVLACCDQLGLPEERVCRQGGALALGHPWGASGAVLLVRLFAQLVDQEQGRYGIAAIAAGGGQGTAMVVQVCR